MCMSSRIHPYFRFRRRQAICPANSESLRRAPARHSLNVAESRLLSLCDHSDASVKSAADPRPQAISILILRTTFAPRRSRTPARWPASCPPAIHREPAAPARGVSSLRHFRAACHSNLTCISQLNVCKSAPQKITPRWTPPTIGRDTENTPGLSRKLPNLYPR